MDVHFMYKNSKNGMLLKQNKKEQGETNKSAVS
jgi:hypothetical protein